MDHRLVTPLASPARTTFRTLTRAMDRRFLALDIAVRLPTAMLPLGLLLYVADRTGSYATSLDTPAGDFISAEDYAVVLLDEIEEPRHRRQRFTAAAA